MDSRDSHQEVTFPWPGKFWTRYTCQWIHCCNDSSTLFGASLWNAEWGWAFYHITQCLPIWMAMLQLEASMERQAWKEQGRTCTEPMPDVWHRSSIAFCMQFHGHHSDNSAFISVTPHVGPDVSVWSCSTDTPNELIAMMKEEQCT